MLLAATASMILGRTSITFHMLWDALQSYDETSVEHVVLLTERLPRTIIAAVVGASLAVAGGLMQALTRNPLASPSVFGINAGAIFFIVIAVVVLSVSSLTTMMWFGFAGAAISAAIVYGLGSLGRDGLTPIKIVLAGTAISALFASLYTGDSGARRHGPAGCPVLACGFGKWTNAGHALSGFALYGGSSVGVIIYGPGHKSVVNGDDIAKGMGQNVLLVKVMMGIVTVLLAGGSVAVAGSIGLVGLCTAYYACIRRQ